MASTIEDRLTSLEARVEAVEGRVPTARQPWFALDLDEARTRLQAPISRGPAAAERLSRIYGRFDGPEDLSERIRDDESRTTSSG